MFRLRTSLCAPCLATALVFSAFAAGATRAADPTPVVRWDFSAEEATPLQSIGGVHRDVPGPRPPEYPDFAMDNTAVKLDGNGAHFVLADTGVQSPFDFTNGDQITLEAWARVDQLHTNENVYIISKGRTGSNQFAADNQNWALRVREMKGQACISFLFATVPASGQAKSDAHWHRWTSSTGFRPGKTWHHVAVSYRFGDPESIRAWIDGRPQTGRWDMGGATAEAPVVDNDAVWIGSSRGGAAANSFRGSLDAIAIYRQRLDDQLLALRYRRVGGEEEVAIAPAPERMPDLGALPAGQVRMVLYEGLPAHERWLNSDEQLPAQALAWNSEALLLDRLPQQFDDWGIRESWNAPVLLQMAADVDLPPGSHRFLMRVRGLSRLWVDGKLIARAKPIGTSPNGEEPITPVAPPPLPGLRSAEHRQQEVFAEAVVGPQGKCRVVLETIVGGQRFRTDPGEVCVAVQPAAGKSFLVLPATAADAIHLTDAEVTAALARQALALEQLDTARRRAAARSRDAYWESRHRIARQWTEEHPAPQSPKSAGHPIDGFLSAKVEAALAASSESSLEQARHFHSQVLPVLRDNCFRCHGDKDQGGLLLNSLAGALKGGDSESPAVVPGEVQHSELIRRVRSHDEGERMPPGGQPLSAAAIATLETWIADGAKWPAPPVTAGEVAPPPTISDAAYVRRVFLDTLGVIPSQREVREFLQDGSSEKRAQLIDRLLADPRWADHWMGYWLDVLAENPTLINASLNTTGPFRWFLYDALRDNKPLDRMVTELILLRGDPHEGGSAGFGIAANNDAPMAAKGQIIASALLGVELQCARCHDSPYHSTKQKDLYSLAAMLEHKPVTVPATSRVPAAFFAKQQRESLIRVTLKPDEAVPPAWPFAEVTGAVDDDSLKELVEHPDDTRERLAALVTAPQNTRFAQVIVNRVWRRLMGSGIVEPPDDWEGRKPSHPELLKWLAQQFIASGYDVQELCRLIMTSDAYQRTARGENRTTLPDLRFFVAPDRRRMSAEQVIDSLVAVSGRPLDVEELTFDPDARRASSNRLTLGVPKRAWMFASLANERDRPSLSLPRARAIVDVMEAFGWSGSRQSPRTDREQSPNVLQPGVLANSTASVLLTRAALESQLAELAVAAGSPDELVDELFLRVLSRLPSPKERRPLAETLRAGFEERVLSENQILAASPPVEPLPAVTWSNHLRPEANTISLELEQRARAGLPPDPRLDSRWRETYEDVVWSLINLPEFVWIP